MIDYSWEILSLYTKPSENGLNNIVKRVTWTYTAKENTYFASVYNDTEFNTIDSNSFISYADLTPEVVFGWISSVVDINEIQKQTQQKLESIKNPESVEKKLPWDRTLNYTGNEEYVLVNTDTIVVGPVKWNSDLFNEELDKLGLPEDLPTNLLCYKQGIVPTNQPLSITENVKIYQVNVIEQPLQENQHLNLSEVFWDFSSGKAEKTHSIITEEPPPLIIKTLDELKEEKINHIKAIVSSKEVSGFVEVEVTSGLGNFSTTNDNVLFYVRKQLILNGDQTVSFVDLNNTEVTLNKNDFLKVIVAVENYLENYKTLYREKRNLINLCTTKEELDNISLEI